jgi:hypothetical protein
VVSCGRCAFTIWGARLADRAVCIGPARASDSYLRIGTLIEAARGVGAQAIHPVMVFHTLGTGGMAMDQIISERDVAAVVGTSLVEINDLLDNGLCSAGPDRAKVALAKGVPAIFAPGNADFRVAGPINRAKAMFPNHRCHMHNHALTAVRTMLSELKALADHMGGLIAEAGFLRLRSRRVTDGCLPVAPPASVG